MLANARIGWRRLFMFDGFVPAGAREYLRPEGMRYYRWCMRGMAVVISAILASVLVALVKVSEAAS